jgi:hypothetical protein
MMNPDRDIDKNTLYEAVKTLVEFEGKHHVQLVQHKLFTLFSIAFQYMLYHSTKEPGAYIIRAEDSQLVDRLARKAKDPTSRKFLQRMLLPRKLKYNNSTFYLDFFHVGTWNITKDIPADKLKGAIIIKNSSTKPMHDLGHVEEPDENDLAILNLPKNYFCSTLQPVCPRIIVIAFDEMIEGLSPVEFEFIQKDKRQTVSGVTLAKDLDWDKIDE